MVLPLIIAGIAAASTIAAASAANSRAAAVNADIEGSIENQEKQYELLRKQRNAEKRESTFQFMREKELYRMNTLQNIRQQRLQNSVATIDFYNQALQLEAAKFANTQQGLMAEQQIQQERGAAYQQGQEVVQATNQQMNEVAQVGKQGDMVAGVTGQVGTARDQARQEALQLTSQTNRAQRTDAVNQIGEQTAQNTNINRQLMQLQQQLTSTGIATQEDLNNQTLSNQAKQSDLNVKLLQQQQQMFNVASRANRIAERQKFKQAGQSDALIHEANIQQLESQMLPTNNLNFGTVLGAAGQIGGALAGYGGLGGLFGGGGGGGQQQGGYGLSSNSAARTILGGAGGSGAGMFSSGGNSAASNGLINFAPPGYSGRSGAPVINFGSPLNQSYSGYNTRMPVFG